MTDNMMPKNILLRTIVIRNRLMERGLVIIECAPLIISKASIIKIIREYKTNSQDDAEVINVLSVK